MNEHEEESSGRSATIDPNNLDHQRKKYSRMLSSGLFGDHQQTSDETPEQVDNTDDNTSDDIDGTKKDSQLSALKTAFIIGTGVLIPVFALSCWSTACMDRIMLLLLKHPIEFLVEAAAIINIPIANYLIWSVTTRGDLRYPLRNGILIGMAAGTALLVSACAAFAVALGYAAMDLNNESRAVLFSLISFAGFVSCIASIILAIDLRNLREFRSARKFSLLFSLGGLLAAILVLVGAETRPFLVRIAESNATSEVAEERDAAIATLKRLDAERELRMECADQRAAGIPGMFIKMDPVMQRQAYFMLTAKPFRDSKASDYTAMPDDYLRRHVVGAPVENLSLARSAMSGTVNGDNLTSTLNWTFVLKNRNYTSQEARAELLLPHGAVIHGVTQWSGEGSSPRTAHVGLISESQSVSVGRYGGLDVTDLGRDRVLIRCPNIAAQSEIKLSIAVVAPLSLNDLKSASLTLPKFIDSNFGMQSENSYRLRSKTSMSIDGDKFKTSKNADGDFLVAGNLKGDELDDLNLTIDLARDPNGPQSVAAYDAVTRTYFSRSIVATQANVPKSLLIVVDGSESMKGSIKSIAESLKQLPGSISTSVLIASTDKTLSSEPLSLSEALSKFKSNEASFIGGQDNLQTVVKAAGLAGESKNGAVLWIHGPQAGLNKELYITAPYTTTPSFFEISIDKGADDAAELFKNHREIGPFTTIARTNNIGADLKHFIAKWQPGGSAYELQYATANSVDAKVVQLKGEDANELMVVGMKREYDEQTKKGHKSMAGRLAYRANIVTPDTAAVISFTQAAAPVMPTRTAQRDMFATAPTGSGSTNGSIAPQGNDATYVTGVNTAGTVRVNNLANLEALLNIIANTTELIGVLSGGILMAFASLRAQMPAIFGIKIGRKMGFALGAVLFFAGLATPGTINWFVASARDANLFE